MAKSPLKEFAQGLREHYQPDDDFSIVEDYDKDRDLKDMDKE